MHCRLERCHQQGNHHCHHLHLTLRLAANFLHLQCQQPLVKYLSPYWGIRPPGLVSCITPNLLPPVTNHYISVSPLYLTNTVYLCKGWPISLSLLYLGNLCDMPTGITSPGFWYTIFYSLTIFTSSLSYNQVILLEEPSQKKTSWGWAVPSSSLARSCSWNWSWIKLRLGAFIPRSVDLSVRLSTTKVTKLRKTIQNL